MAAKKKTTRKSAPTFDQVEREKQARRDADEAAVREGRLTPKDVSRRNGLLHGAGWKADLKSAKRLW